MRNFKWGVLIVTISVLMTLTACGDSGKDSASTAASDEEANVIDMGQISWAENIAVTNMWKVILEDEGYQVNFHLLDMGTQMAALSNNELDINLEVWLPVQDAAYLDQYQDEVNFSEEVWYEHAKVGLVVPEYLEDINSIEDLNENRALFDGEITGFDPGAGTMDVTEDLIAEYGLEFELLPSSEPAMITEIEEAVAEKEAIVAPLWSPHRVFAEMDLKYLEDPKNVYGETEKIHHATRQGFSEEFPEVSQWIKNWKMEDEQISELMSYVSEAEEPSIGAEKWVEENQDLINEWLNG
ncbi:glycine betaine ABC transporter substrate-binding protein [Virgibacillus xinjiangensis]|uniref:Glycine betaine ABC transporter substrate-binding protein n=1 Tax=Virgibacillus xinjiangensis TaxID=393090 RepID=A0ABV7CXN4_9BACI